SPRAPRPPSRPPAPSAPPSTRSSRNGTARNGSPRPANSWPTSSSSSTRTTPSATAESARPPDASRSHTHQSPAPVTPAPIRRTDRPPDATGRATHSHPAPHRAKPHQSGAPTSDRQTRSGFPFAVFVLAHGRGGHGDRVARGLAGHHLLATLPPGAVRDGEPSDRCEEDDQAVTVTQRYRLPGADGRTLALHRPHGPAARDGGRLRPPHPGHRRQGRDPGGRTGRWRVHDLVRTAGRRGAGTAAGMSGSHPGDEGQPPLQEQLGGRTRVR